MNNFRKMTRTFVILLFGNMEIGYIGLFSLYFVQILESYIVIKLIASKWIYYNALQIKQ